MKQNKKIYKQYSIDQSPLYHILGKGQLEKVLDIELEKLDLLLSPSNYRVWINKQEREIQQPIGWLEKIHFRIGSYLKKVELPSYVFSRRGKSYINNAAYHRGNVLVGKTDINKFYPSVTHGMMKKVFADEFKCAGDIAGILADICCYQQKHLPTGSSLSGLCAFFAGFRMFEEINALIEKSGNKMSVFVDDITLSGLTVNKKLLSEVCACIRKYGFKTKQCKTKTFSANSAKIITGVVVFGEELRLPNSRHKKIRDAKAQILCATGCEREVLQKSLNGRLQEARQVLTRTIA